jgi:hypothetical protein
MTLLAQAQHLVSALRALLCFTKQAKQRQSLSQSFPVFNEELFPLSLYLALHQSISIQLSNTYIDTYTTSIIDCDRYRSTRSAIPYSTNDRNREALSVILYKAD